MTTNRKQYLKKLIYQLFKDIYPVNQDVKKNVERLGASKKKIAVLSILDKDEVFKKLRSLSVNNKIPKIEFLENIISIFRTYVKIGDVDKKNFGEVMTPLELVEEILDVLPKETWQNPKLKVLDPCNGVGIFTSVIIKRFMEGLKNFEPNEKKRYKYIMENIVYVCELQSKNMFLYLCTFDFNDEYALNTYQGSFLDDKFDKHMREEWGISNFDLIIGNPPYNQSIDLKFMNKSYAISNKILFVHPATWLIDEKNIQKKFTKSKELIKKNLEKVILFNGNKAFGIQLFVPCSITYVNKEFLGKIEVVDKINNKKALYGNINNINKYSSVEYVSIRNKLKNMCDVDNVWNHYNTDGEYYVNLSAIRGHISTNNDDFLIKDDFYTTVTKNEAVSTKKEKYLYFGFHTKKEATNFLNYNKTKFFRFALSIFKNNGNLHRGELSIVPWLDFSSEWNDEKLYRHFNLDEDEISFIEGVLPDYY